MWELGAGEVALVGVWRRGAPLASGLLGVGVGRTTPLIRRLGRMHEVHPEG